MSTSKCPKREVNANGKSLAERCLELCPSYERPIKTIDNLTGTSYYTKWNGQGTWESLTWKFGKWVFNQETQQYEFDTLEINGCEQIKCNTEEVWFNCIPDGDYTIVLIACVYDDAGNCCCKSFDWCNFDCKGQAIPKYELVIDIPNGGTGNVTGFSYRYRIGSQPWVIPPISTYILIVPDIREGEVITIEKLTDPNGVGIGGNRVGYWSNYIGLGANVNSAAFEQPSNASVITSFAMPASNGITTLNFNYYSKAICLNANSQPIFIPSSCPADPNTILSPIPGFEFKFEKKLNDTQLSPANVVPFGNQAFEPAIITEIPLSYILNDCVLNDLCVTPKRALALHQAQRIANTDITKYPRVELDPDSWNVENPFTLEFFIYINLRNQILDPCGSGTTDFTKCYPILTKGYQSDLDKDGIATAGNNKRPVFAQLIAFQGTGLGGCAPSFSNTQFVLYFTYQTDESEVEGRFIDLSNLPARQWIHIAITCTPSSVLSTSLKLYVNGVSSDALGSTTVNVNIDFTNDIQNNVDMQNSLVTLCGVHDLFKPPFPTANPGSTINTDSVTDTINPALYQQSTPYIINRFRVFNKILTQVQIQALFNIGEGIANPSTIVGISLSDIRTDLLFNNTTGTSTTPQNGTLYAGTLMDFDNDNFVLNKICHSSDLLPTTPSSTIFRFKDDTSTVFVEEAIPIPCVNYPCVNSHAPFGPIGNDANLEFIPAWLKI
jgi:hypothetical protein